MKFKRGKKIMVYGVEMTSLENMLFDKYISTSGIAMNTKNREERFQITNDWLKNQ